MKIITITIDEKMLVAIDLLASRASGHAPRGGRGKRSAVVREALREHLAHHAKAEAEEREWRVWVRHMKRINQQAAALIVEQAEA